MQTPLQTLGLTNQEVARYWYIKALDALAGHKDTSDYIVSANQIRSYIAAQKAGQCPFCHRIFLATFLPCCRMCIPLASLECFSSKEFYEIIDKWEMFREEYFTPLHMNKQILTLPVCMSIIKITYSMEYLKA